MDGWNPMNAEWMAGNRYQDTIRYVNICTYLLREVCSNLNGGMKNQRRKINKWGANLVTDTKN